MTLPKGLLWTLPKGLLGACVVVLPKSPPAGGALDALFIAEPPNRVPACDGAVVVVPKRLPRLPLCVVVDVPNSVPAEGAEGGAAEDAPSSPPSFEPKSPPDCGCDALLLGPLHSSVLVVQLLS